MKFAPVVSFRALAPRGVARHLPAVVRRNPRAAGALTLVAVTLVVLAGWRWTRPAGPAVSYSEYPLKRGDIMVLVSAPGEITPQNRIELKPPLAGRLEKVLVREGDNVKKGDVLAWISPAERAALLDAARAKGPEEVARWEDAYKAAPLVAPVNGFIIARRAEPGQTLGGNEAPLVMADRLIVKAQVDETDMGRVKIGQSVEVTMDAYPDMKLPGRVDHLAYEARSVNNVTVYDIEVELLRSARVLRAGMTATASIQVTNRKNVWVVPAEALQDSPDGVAVLVKRKGRKPQQVVVTPGANDGAQMEITSGLLKDDIIMIPITGVAAAKEQAGNPFMPGRPQRQQAAQSGNTKSGSRAGQRSGGGRAH